MGAPQAGRRDHLEAITLLSWLVVSLTTILLSLGCHARVTWISMRCWVGTRTGYFFYFLPWGGTSTHTILCPETECTKVIQSLNNYQLTYLAIYILKTGLKSLNQLRSAATLAKSACGAITPALVQGKVARRALCRRVSKP